MKANPSSAVNPSQASIDLLATWPDDGPIAMLNLLAYNGADGRAAYGRYGTVASKTVAARGGSVICMGSVVEPTTDWDTVVLVYYPRRAAYLDMQLDQAYLDVIPERTAGLRARLLYPFALPKTDVAPKLTGTNDEVLGLTLSSYANPADLERPAATSQTSLELPSGGPGMVADRRWDHLSIVRYPTAHAYQNREQIEIGEASGIDATLELLVQPAGAL